MSRDERPVPMEKKVVGLGPVAAPDKIDVARSPRDDQPGLRALSLDEGIDGGGRAVDQLADRRRIQAALADAVDDALDELRGRGEALRLRKPAGAPVERHQVRKRAPDVDRRHEHGGIIRRWAKRPPNAAAHGAWAASAICATTTRNGGCRSTTIVGSSSSWSSKAPRPACPGRRYSTSGTTTAGRSPDLTPKSLRASAHAR